MGNSVNLTPEQKALKEKLQSVNQKLWSFIKKETHKIPTHEEIQAWYDEMSRIAHELHMSLKESGYEPKHHKYMLENRGVPVEEIEFYRHVHPVDDLLKFIDDINANDDPEDTTIGKKFTLKIYTRRWGHYDQYAMIRTEKGWDLQVLMPACCGECEKKVSLICIKC